MVVFRKCSSYAANNQKPHSGISKVFSHAQDLLNSFYVWSMSRTRKYDCCVIAIPQLLFLVFTRLLINGRILIAIHTIWAPK